MARIHLLIGPVGAGKSTVALSLALRHRAVRLNLDEWMATLFAADRPTSGDTLPWYLERVDRCLEQLWKTTVAALDADVDVVLEAGLIQREARARFYERVDAIDAALTVHVVDAPREVRRERVRRRNEERGATFSMVVPDAIFERASDLWEPPDAQERDERDVVDR